jgi:hypothetical protein
MVGQRPNDPPWRRDDLDGCHQYSFAPTDRLSLPAFQEKLRAKHQPESLCQQAEHAVSLYWETGSPVAIGPRPAADADARRSIETRNAAQEAQERAPNHFPATIRRPLAPPGRAKPRKNWPDSSRPAGKRTPRRTTSPAGNRAKGRGWSKGCRRPWARARGIRDHVRIQPPVGDQPE